MFELKRPTIMQSWCYYFVCLVHSILNILVDLTENVFL